MKDALEIQLLFETVYQFLIIAKIRNFYLKNINHGRFFGQLKRIVYINKHFKGKKSKKVFIIIKKEQFYIPYHHQCGQEIFLSDSDYNPSA